jgi:predicted O-methyltransferase YrrM
MKILWAIYSYIVYLLKSRSRYKTHSPFVYDLINDVLRDKENYPKYYGLHKYRMKLSGSSSMIETVDFGSGAGKKEYRTFTEKVGKLAKQRTHSRKRLELLFRLTQYFKPDQILEIGTAVGFSSLYLKRGNTKSKLTTMEGCAGLAHIANKGFKVFHFDDVQIVVGNFNVLLAPTIEKFETLDMVFFDGNHQEKPTLNYFEQCMIKANENSVFMFDDIHWSPGMSKAWKKIKNDPRVAFTIDIYWLGLVFFKKSLAKQHFVIRY